MKRLLVVLVAAIPCFGTSISGPIVDKVINVDKVEFAKDLIKTFETEKDLEEWASETSWGGWRIQAVDPDKCLLVFRSFTSGVDSGDLSIFKRKNDEWVRVVYFRVTHLGHYWVTQNEEKLIVTSYSSAKNENVQIASIDWTKL